MQPEEQKAWDEEKQKARKFIGRSSKIAAVTHLDDGKDDVFLRMSYADLVELLAAYGVDRLVQTVQEIAEVAQSAENTP